MDPVIPPTPHRLPGHELFDLVAKRDGRQIRAIFKRLRMNQVLVKNTIQLKVRFQTTNIYNSNSAKYN